MRRTQPILPILDARAIHESLASEDKQLKLIDGDHYLQQPRSARSDVADMIAAWLVGQR